MPRNFLFALGICLCITACKDDPLPKPKAQLRLDYPNANFARSSQEQFSFEHNIAASVNTKNKGAFTLNYPDMGAAIFLTYYPVTENLDALLSDAQKFAYEHVGRADAILEQPFVNKEAEVYGMFYEVKGNAASQAQFYVTDSTRHFLTGSLYFFTRPNYDSIYPAAMYLQNDIRHLMETLQWE